MSPDDAASHRKFKAKFGLRNTLVVDEGHAICDRYGVWVKKTTFGKTYMGVARTTFVIDPRGRIAKVFEKVTAAGHAGEVAAALEELQKAMS